MFDRIIAVSAFLVLTVTACSGGGGASRSPNLLPVTPSAPVNVSSQPAPSSVHFTNYASADGGGGVIIGSDGAVYVGGYAHFVRFSRGSFSYYTYGSVAAGDLGGGAPDELVQTADGAIWTFTSAAGGPAEVETDLSRLLLPSFTVSNEAFAFGIFSLVSGLTRDSRGNVWTSSTSGFDGELIGFSPSLTHEFGPAIPQPDGEPQATLAIGFNEALFSVSNPIFSTVNRIYEFSVPDGTQLHSWTLPGTANVNFMTLGPDDALWFTDRSQNAIGHLSATGVLKFYPVPTAAAGLTAIAAGSDSAMWFTETDANKIGRIAMDGSINEYSLPSGVRAPRGITGGFPSCLSGTLYFTNSTGLGKLTF